MTLDVGSLGEEVGDDVPLPEGENVGDDDDDGDYDNDDDDDNYDDNGKIACPGVGTFELFGANVCTPGKEISIFQLDDSDAGYFYFIQIRQR